MTRLRAAAATRYNGPLVMASILAAIAAAVLLLVRALAVAAEAALGATSTEGLEERGAPGATVDAFVRLKTRPEATFPTLRAVLAMSLAFGAGAASFAGAVWAREHVMLAGVPNPEALGAALGAVAAALLATFLDLGARALASADPVRAAMRATRWVFWTTAVLGPPLRLVAAAVDLVVRPLGANARLAPPRPPLEDLERLLQEEARSRELDPQSPGLIRNIFEMSELTARDVMVPRTGVVALDISTPAAEILRVLAEHGHSRMPVYTGDIDNIVGILHARDLVPMLQNPELIVVQDIIRPARFIPWSKPVGELLREMQKKRIHMALVVDEYGGFMGVVTLEDVLEVIVGDIQDEYAEDVPEIEALPDASHLVRASVPRDAFARAFQVELPDGEFETLGGFLNYLAGCIPEAGDKFFYAGLQLTVQDRTPKRVRRVRVQRVASSAAETPPRRREAASA